MEKAIKKRNHQLFISILLSVLGVLSIPGIVFSAIYQIFFLLAPCIAIVVFDFYGLIFLYNRYGDLANRVKILRIVDNGITDFKTISQTIGKNPNYVLNALRKAITDADLKGYVIQNEQLIKTTNNKDELEILNCPNCGSKKVSIIDNVYVCEYCGAKLKKIK